MRKRSLRVLGLQKDYTKASFFRIKTNDQSRNTKYPCSNPAETGWPGSGDPIAEVPPVKVNTCPRNISAIDIDYNSHYSDHKIQKKESINGKNR
jgi:hypothetical protein